VALHRAGHPARTDADLTLDQAGIRNTHEALAKADD
jgi:hypothetical protein